MKAPTEVYLMSTYAFQVSITFCGAVHAVCVGIYKGWFPRLVDMGTNLDDVSRCDVS